MYPTQHAVHSSTGPGRAHNHSGPFPFQDFTGVVPLHSKLNVDACGVRRSAILKADYTLLVIAVATAQNGKEILYVLLEFIIIINLYSASATIIWALSEINHVIEHKSICYSN